ncbi:MAG: hypothetical protein EBY39_03255 [Flavobacteriia bacterium]|nr:hypothetical protein [Flavobacteriia bacterium]
MGEGIMWQKIGRVAPYVLLYIFSFAVVGLFNFVSAQFRSDIITSSEFWNKTISQNLANLIVFSTTISLFNNKNMEENKEYLEMNSTVTKAVRQDIQSDFGQWVFDKNKVEKKRTYIEQINGIISKEEIKAKPADLNVWYNGTTADKKKNKYCKRRNKLLRLIDSKRLEKFIISMKVDYDEINRSFIESGEAKETKKQNQKLAGPGRIIKDSTPRFLLGFAFVIFINSFIYTANVGDVAFWFQVFFSLVILLYMFIMGRSYAEDYLKKVLIVDLQTRFNIIRDYLSDKVKEVNNG